MPETAADKPRKEKRKMLCFASADGNPYQRLLYSDIRECLEIEFSGPRALSSLKHKKFDVIHLHWEDRIFGRGEDVIENRSELATALEQLSAFKRQGGRIVWTIHNRVPHKEGDVETFRDARRKLAKLADAIHVHAPHASEHMQTVYGAPGHKIHVIPHPSYLGAYEPEARTLKRGLSESKIREFLFFGMFRAAKGIHEIQNVAAKLTKRDVSYHLRMYGRAFGPQARLVRRLEENSRIDVRPDRIPDDEIPEIFGKSHIFLAPYQSLFTSGSVMLAQTFGLPIIGPNIRELRETTPEACHHLLYDPNAPRGLIRSMLRAVEMSQAELMTARRACFAFAQERSPELVAASISRLLDPQI